MADGYDDRVETHMTERISGEKSTLAQEQARITSVSPTALPLVRRLPGNISIFEFLGYQQMLWYDWLHDIGMYTYRRLKTRPGVTQENIVNDVSYPVRRIESPFYTPTYHGKDFDHASENSDGDREIGRRDGQWADNTHPVRVATIFQKEFTRYDIDNVEYVRVTDSALARAISGYINGNDQFVGPATFEEYRAAINQVPATGKQAVEIPEFYPGDTDRLLSAENSDSIRTQDMPITQMPWGIQYRLCRREPAALKSASPFDTGRKNWKYKFTGHIQEPESGNTYAIYTRFWDNLVSYEIVTRGILERDYLMALMEDFYTSCSGLFLRAGICQTLFLGQTKDPVYMGNSPSSLMKEAMVYAFYRSQEFRVIGPVPLLAGVNLVADVNAEEDKSIES